jgi:hypothetical protein
VNGGAKCPNRLTTSAHLANSASDENPEKTAA